MRVGIAGILTGLALGAWVNATTPEHAQPTMLASSAVVLIIVGSLLCAVLSQVRITRTFSGPDDIQEHSDDDTERDFDES
jgi:hypothetical protein